MNKIYVRLTKNACEFDNDTGIWKFKLPDNFMNSRSDSKKITVLNFMYYATYIPSTGPLQIDYTTLHSPTLCDGNYNQDNYIATLCYNYNTVFKTYQIKSNPQYMEFYFKNMENEIVKLFYHEFVEPTTEGNVERVYEERFSIDLELVF